MIDDAPVGLGGSGRRAGRVDGDVLDVQHDFVEVQGLGARGIDRCVAVPVNVAGSGVGACPAISVASGQRPRDVALRHSFTLTIDDGGPLVDFLPTAWDGNLS